MNAQSIVGWLVIFVLFGYSLKQAIFQGRIEDPRGTMAGILIDTGSVALVFYGLVWIAWILVFACSVFIIEIAWLNALVDWSYEALVSPWRWLHQFF